MTAVAAEPPPPPAAPLPESVGVTWSVTWWKLTPKAAGVEAKAAAVAVAGLRGTNRSAAGGNSGAATVGGNHENFTTRTEQRNQERELLRTPLRQQRRRS